MTINTLTKSIFYLFDGDEITFPDVKFVLAYQSNIKPTPLTKPIVAFSTQDCQISDKLKNVLDTGEVVTTEERNIKITLSVNIYMPYSSDAMKAVAIYEKMASSLLFKSDLAMKVTGSTCGEAIYDSSCQAIVLKTTFTLEDNISE